MRDTKLTISVRPGLVRFYRDLAKFSNTDFDELIASELLSIARATINSLDKIAYCDANEMLGRYKLEE